MSLLKKIGSDYIAAYKAKDKDRVSVLRMLKSELKNKQVETGNEPSDAEVLDLITKQVKQRKESIEQYSNAGREELAEQEAAEMALLKEYLPEALTQEELEKAIDDTIAELGAEGMKDMGRVMGQITAAYKGRIDGKVASSLVRAKLNA
ncbi:GatB/YqeY domain-containing protein [Desulfobaculum bizertense]|uniref:GatB/YqeY domain-containing protein n=1 Tax=Desulfobaculum bizertense DSM 18034 TaxID=1121442 RepID=A0A1T4W1E8_9BACT|nr:GatB/YqeY domain-containing protein [Desulfobaculum bizertense]UIJ38909.1 GatB/YqeY domain-containing protein [Desulfobaculum bizertense]SKA71072.1 hypothetical protein SAMN02745702_01407 [Desulfobaculum bizertense DSM 18034]